MLLELRGRAYCVTYSEADRLLAFLCIWIGLEIYSVDIWLNLRRSR